MNKKWVYILILSIIFASVITAACTGADKKEDSKPPLLHADSSTDPEDYFPMEGKWYYKVELRDTMPLLFRATYTEVLRAQLLTQSRFLLLKKSNPYNLIISIPEYKDLGNGAKLSELEILKDDLRVLADPFLITWSISESQGTKIVSQRIYHEDGISARPIFYATVLEALGDTRMLNNQSAAKSEEVIMYKGLDNSAPGCERQACMKFVRKITKGSGKYGYTDNGFTEENYFAKDKGLVYLVQKVELQDGSIKTSMTWTLERYIKN